MRIQIPLVIEMSDEQVRQYASANSLPAEGGRLYARDVVANVQRKVLACVHDSDAFGATGDAFASGTSRSSVRRNAEGSPR